LTINSIYCTITKPEERFKVTDLEINKGTPLVDKNRRLKTDYRKQISDQYRINYFILDDAHR
jgi:hypothetical protein